MRGAVVVVRSAVVVVRGAVIACGPVIISRVVLAVHFAIVMLVGGHRESDLQRMGEAQSGLGVQLHAHDHPVGGAGLETAVGLELEAVIVHRQHPLELTAVGPEHLEATGAHVGRRGSHGLVELD